MYMQDLARARQQEIAVETRQRIWHRELRWYRRKDGRMQVLRLPRH